jgi:hypothetical protein
MALLLMRKANLKRSHPIGIKFYNTSNDTIIEIQMFANS